MKAITLTQPWATLVAIGAKTIETRSWGTPYRGELAIHAAKGLPKQAQALYSEDPFHFTLREAGIMSADELPRGVIVAVASLVSVELMDQRVIENIECGSGLGAYPAFECEFGHYEVGRYAWFLKEIRPVQSVAVRGALGLWEVPAGIITESGVTPVGERRTG